MEEDDINPDSEQASAIDDMEQDALVDAPCGSGSFQVVLSSSASNFIEGPSGPMCGLVAIGISGIFDSLLSIRD